MNPANSASSYRNTGVDALRGVSILAVLLLHLNIHFSINSSFIKEWLPAKLFSVLFWSGYNGVVVFFTLSGYLITLSSLNKWQSLEQLKVKQFYLMRAARILPMLVTLLLVLSLLHLLNIPGFVISPDRASLTQALFSALTFQMNWLQINVGYLPANWDVLWSISIEESFYLVFPLACLLVRNEKLFVALLIIFLVISPWARVSLFPDNELGDRNHLSYIDSLGIGCLVALLSSRLSILPNVKNASLVLGVVLLVISFAYKGMIYRSGLTQMGLNVSLLSVGVGLVLIWLHGRQSRARRFSWTYHWLCRWGTFSYEIYLTHMFVVIVAAKIFTSFEVDITLLIPFLLISSLACYWLGKGIFYHFSEPLNKKIRHRFQSY